MIQQAAKSAARNLYTMVLFIRENPEVAIKKKGLTYKPGATGLIFTSQQKEMVQEIGVALAAHNLVYEVRTFTILIEV